MALISTIAQVIIEMRAFRLVEDCVISRYITPREVITILKHYFSKWSPRDFLDVFEEETNKMKENSIAMIIT